MTSNITAAAAHSGSHCWEDGSFHSVCIFVISVSLVCSLVTVVTAWRVAVMVASALRSDWSLVHCQTDGNKSLRDKYHSLPMNQFNGFVR